ncbi:SWIM zinc finger family protein [Lacihabitans soyangensis]|uniref:SWIM zinc finger family protein n=1 Tax=Lacihabitans soyangensis TaxID=869394 RepID=A0AAE3H2E8_9BACT|nr:SWIM zinc finger family protein [Lacihabitans soyangensis]MCP9763548.1 SWIM zinc finger family protein [Lacihabitans soyangensis]
MTTTAEYSYNESSLLEKIDNRNNLILSHQTELEEINKIPTFFWGRMREPYLTAKCLLTVAKTVRSKFALSTQELAALRDPIVTAGAEQIRFEGFSSCNGVYARLDILPEGLDGEFVASGTTNVDFNEPMLNALNLVQKNEEVILSIGHDNVTVISEKTKAVEKKVKLPNRWLKGLTSVQHYLAEMNEVFELNKMQAIQLFQSLPKTNIKNDLFLVQRAGKFIFSPLQSNPSVRIGSAHRLRVMDNILPFIYSIKVYESDDSQASCFVALIGNLQMIFSFSADAYRGFSGEGKALENLIEEVPIEWIYGINSIFKGNEVFNSTKLSIENDIDFSTMDSLTANLSSMGLLGFDVLNNQHFYRRLPFKTERILSLNPRLKNAKKIVSENDVIIVINTPSHIEAIVKGKDVTHKVLIENGIGRCTCEWFTKHQTNRGMCKHMLAVKMMTSNQE